MKFQFQFAGVNSDRPVPQAQRRKNRWILIGISFAFASLCYWQYLRYLTHGSILFMQIRKPVPVAAAKPTTAKGVAAPVAVATEETAKEKLPTSVKDAAESTIVSAWNHVAESVALPVAPVAAPVAPVAESAPHPTTATVAPISVPVVSAPAKAAPTITRKPKPVETPEQRLQRAGQKAYDEMLGRANANPDAYGFLPSDAFTETRLGAAIPVYTINEKERASYQRGQGVLECLKPSNQWVFPVYSGDRLCCMVQVTYNGHEYVPGGATKFLAMAWNKIAERWPVSDGYHPRLVVNPRHSGYYFTVPELPDQNITDTFTMFDMSPTLSPADVILASWR